MLTAKKLLRTLNEKADPMDIGLFEDKFDSFIWKIEDLSLLIARQTQGSMPMSDSDKRAVVDHLKEAMKGLVRAKKNLSK